MQEQTSSAYEYSRFEEKQPEQKVEITQVKHRHKKQISVLKALGYMFFALTLLSMLIYSKAMQVELDSQNAELQKQISEVKDDNVRMQIKLESSMSLKNIEEIAKNELGLEKQKDQQVDVINFDVENRAVVVKKQTAWEGIKAWFQKTF